MASGFSSKGDNTMKPIGNESKKNFERSKKILINELNSWELMAEGKRHHDVFRQKLNDTEEAWNILFGFMQTMTEYCYKG